LQRFEEVVEERVAGGEAQDEPPAAAADGAGDGDDAEAEPFRVATALAVGQSEQLQPGKQVEGEQSSRVKPLPPGGAATQRLAQPALVGLAGGAVVSAIDAAGEHVVGARLCAGFDIAAVDPDRGGT